MKEPSREDISRLVRDVGEIDLDQIVSNGISNEFFERKLHEQGVYLGISFLKSIFPNSRLNYPIDLAMHLIGLRSIIEESDTQGLDTQGIYRNFCLQWVNAESNTYFPDYGTKPENRAREFEKYFGIKIFAENRAINNFMEEYNGNNSANQITLGGAKEFFYTFRENGSFKLPIRLYFRQYFDKAYDAAFKQKYGFTFTEYMLSNPLSNSNSK